MSKTDLRVGDTVVYLNHQVHNNRVPQCLSSRRNWDLPTPSPVSECVPPPEAKEGGRHIRLRVRAGGGPNSDDWRKSLAPCLLCVLNPFPQQGQKSCWFDTLYILIWWRDSFIRICHARLSQQGKAIERRERRAGLYQLWRTLQTDQGTFICRQYAGMCNYLNRQFAPPLHQSMGENSG